MPNRLIDETSPYLLQHAHNPVDWHAWGPEALERSRREDKPILLSVGYSACHWCHVMERESFEDRRTAELMNESFVCIKVDREERPDVDSIYMSAVQAMTGQGGWPMTVFLMPDCRPFFGGTYFPPESRHGMPGFPDVLRAIARAFREDRRNVIGTTEQLLQRMRTLSESGRSRDPLTTEVMDRSFSALAAEFDDRHGGMGTQPKFPQPMIYEFLLRYHVRSQRPRALEIVEVTLDRMARGGICDQIGGGFHRYSTDSHWLVPHFEKMLYDNALLAKLYLHAHQVTGKSLYRRVVEDTLDYVNAEMSDPAGGFYSSQDADSQGVEGKFFVWEPAELIDVLGEEVGTMLNRYFGVTPAGNFEGRNILRVAEDAASVVERSGMTVEAFNALLRRSRDSLFDARNARVRPARDDKVLTSWNALMLRSFAEAGAVLCRPDYVEIANRNAKFLLSRLRSGGRLLRTHKDGRAKLNGYLEDYSFLVDALFTLHEATFSQEWLREAIGLARAMVDLFWDEESGQFYDTGRDHETLIVRPRDVTDSAIPSGGAMATDVLLRLAVVTGEADLQRIAVAALRSAGEVMTGLPRAAGHWLCALDFHLSTPREIVIVGDQSEPETRALAAEVFRHYRPNRVLVGVGGGEAQRVESPLLRARERIGGRPTAYVCESYVCKLPVTDPADLARQLVE